MYVRACISATVPLCLEYVFLMHVTCHKCSPCGDNMSHTKPMSLNQSSRSHLIEVKCFFFCLGHLFHMKGYGEIELFKTDLFIAFLLENTDRILIAIGQIVPIRCIMMEVDQIIPLSAYSNQIYINITLLLLLCFS